MKKSLEFRVLGPLVVRVDGAPVSIGGPKQRALLGLLLLSANRVVSRERLIGELFVDQSVNSADHALRNQISRLRKVLVSAGLDEPRLVARPPGYLLRVESGELDLEQFEKLVEEGRDALARGEADVARDAFRTAEGLWQGRPLADLEFEPFARVEVERLEECRLGAVEDRIDAELAIGRQHALVAELEALSSEHPYRERLRAQLMLALYRSGRQAEGLEVYRTTRRLLQVELGLVPGPELQELERAILTQDPELRAVVVPTPRPTPQWTCPYKGLAPFETADADLFFGRERLVDELAARFAEMPLLAVIGSSGSGKSSLLRAGLLPALDQFEHRLIRPGDLPAVVLGATPIVVAVDQFEELFAASISEGERLAFIDSLVEAAWDPERRAQILIALRADFFGQLGRYRELAELVSANQVLLGPMSASNLRRAIEGPAARAGLEFEPGLVDRLIDDVGHEVGGLALLSTALVDLWGERERGTLTIDAYERTGGIHGAVGRHAEAAFTSLDPDDQVLAHRFLLRLVAGGNGTAVTRRRVRFNEFESDDGERVSAVLATLVERRLLVADESAVELVHEALLDHWPRLTRWLEDDAHGRRVHDHLSEAATRWNDERRDAGELYRGARLAAALEWIDDAANGRRLNGLERAFLHGSRVASARTQRRLRMQLAAALFLLLASLVAGAVALRARATARHQATAAVAQRLGAQALVEPKLDRALLFVRQGVRLDDSAATRSNLLAALLRSPAAIAVAHGFSSRILDDALSPDGRLLAIRGDDGTVAFLDTKTMRAAGPTFTSSGQVVYFGAIKRPIRSLAFSPDGRTLVVGDSDGYWAEDYVVHVRARRAGAPASSAAGVATADVAFAPDGKTFVTGEATTGSKPSPPEVLVTRRATDGTAIRHSKLYAAGRLIGFTHGRQLLETSGESTSYLLDAKTFARVRSFRIGGAVALSPVADLAAFGHDDGSVILLDLHSGTQRAMDLRATGKVVSLAFSSDGRMLATGSDDGSVTVWDVPTAAWRERFVGHDAAAVGPRFSPDGSTLYSASSDGSVIAWDVGGARRLGRPFRFSPRARPGAGTHQSARHASTAVAVSPDGSRFVTSPGPNRLTLWRSDPQAPIGTLRGPFGSASSVAWSQDGRLVAAVGDSNVGSVWDLASRKVVRRLGGLGSMGAAGVRFSPDQHLVATAGIDGVLRIFSLATGRMIGTRVRGSLQDLDFSPDGAVLAAAGLAGDIVIWNLRHHTVQTFPHGAAVFTIRFSPDGKTIATGDVAGNIDFWNPATGQQFGRTIGGQNGYVSSVSFDPIGKRLLSTSADGKVRLWDVASGKLEGSPLYSDTNGWGAFFPDGKQVIVVFDSGTGVVFNVDPAAWNAHACRIANRELTRAEWGDVLPGRAYRSVCR